MKFKIQNKLICYDILTGKSELDKYYPEEYGIERYNINDDGTLNVYQNIVLSFKGLKHIPFQFNYIDGHLTMSDNELTSLKGSPRVITKNFVCSHNKLNSLENAPISVGGDFGCSGNKNLTSLKGSPKIVGGAMYCNTLNLKSFNHTPKDLKYLEASNTKFEDERLKSLLYYSDYNYFYITSDNY